MKIPSSTRMWHSAEMFHQPLIQLISHTFAREVRGCARAELDGKHSQFQQLQDF